MVDYEIRKSNRRTMSIKVDSKGNLIVYAPYFYSEKKINDFVLSKENWIKKCQNEAINTNKKYNSKDLVEGDYIYFLGDKYKLIFQKVKQVEFVKNDENLCILPVNYQKNTENKLKTYLKKQGEMFLKAILDDRAKVMNFSGYTFKLTTARTKWGSCSRGGEIMLNFRLMLCPVSVIEYVASHELAHLKELNHSKRFYDILTYYYPNSKMFVKWLKDNAGVLNSY